MQLHIGSNFWHFQQALTNILSVINDQWLNWTILDQPIDIG